MKGEMVMSTGRIMVMKLICMGVILPFVFAMIFSVDGERVFWVEYMLFWGAYLMALIGYVPICKKLFVEQYKWYWDLLLLVWFDMAVSGLFVMAVSII